MSAPVRIITITAEELRSLIREELRAALRGQATQAPSPPPPRRLYMSLSEAERESGYSSDTLRRWIREGRLRAERAGRRGHYRIRPEDLQAALRPAAAEAPVDPDAIARAILTGRR